MDQSLNILVTINAATLITVLVLGYRIIRFISRMEVEHELIWTDYLERKGTVHTHKREYDT